MPGAHRPPREAEPPAVRGGRFPITPVGTLSTTDLDVGDSFTYSRVSGTGSGDNGKVKIAGAQLQTSQALDFDIERMALI